MSRKREKVNRIMMIKRKRKECKGRFIEGIKEKGDWIMKTDDNKGRDREKGRIS